MFLENLLAEMYITHKKCHRFFVDNANGLWYRK